MRIYLLKRLGVNFFAANLAWPLVILPAFLVRFIGTFFTGHAESIVDEYYEAYLLAVRRAEWAREDEREENGFEPRSSG